MFEASIFLTTLVFPLITAPQISVPAVWERISWQPPEEVRFIEQSYAKDIKSIKEEIRACSLNYCSVKFRQNLEPKLLAKVPETGFFVYAFEN